MTTMAETRKSVVPAKTGTQDVDSPLRGNDRRTAKGKPARKIEVWQHRALRAEWAKFSPGLDGEGSEDDLRHGWSSEILHRPVVTWRDLTYGEAKALLRELKERSGSNAAYRAQLIARLAVELWGGSSGSTGGWDAFLRERLRERFRLSTLDSLAPAQAHELIEELLSRIARRDGVEIEDVRRRITIRR